MTTALLRHLPDRPHRRLRPESRLGWWAVALFAGLVVLQGAWTLMGPLGAFPAFASGLAGGLLGIVAYGRGDRAVSVAVAALFPFVVVAFFVLGELLLPH